MTTEAEYREEQHRERQSADKPRCHKCHRPEGEVDLVWCDKLTCGNNICNNCATETEWELEACCDQHASEIARKLRETIYILRGNRRQADRTRTTRRAA